MPMDICYLTNEIISEFKLVTLLAEEVIGRVVI